MDQEEWKKAGWRRMNVATEAFERASVEELAEGVLFDGQRRCWICLVCGRGFAQGEIFPREGRFWEAGEAARLHVREEHGPLGQWLADLETEWGGLSEVQGKVVAGFLEGLDDGALAARLSVSRSTVRNHRFRLKERARQAKVLLALMRVLESGQSEEDRFVEYPAHARGVDERYAVTEEEYARILRKYLGEDGRLVRFPLKAKERVALLRHLVQELEPGRRYAEREVNELLQAFHPDHGLLRRCLIDYGCMERTRDGSAYWVRL